MTIVDEWIEDDNSEIMYQKLKHRIPKEAIRGIDEYFTNEYYFTIGSKEKLIEATIQFLPDENLTYVRRKYPVEKHGNNAVIIDCSINNSELLDMIFSDINRVLHQIKGE